MTSSILLNAEYQRAKQIDGSYVFPPNLGRTDGRVHKYCYILPLWFTSIAEFCSDDINPISRELSLRPSEHLYGHHDLSVTREGDGRRAGLQRA
jgi:hypothetical protein